VLITDGHLDIAMNALQWNRDLLLSVHTIRTQEDSVPGKARANSTVAFPEMRSGRIMLSFATLFARSTGQPRAHVDFASPIQAYGIARGQLAYYEALERWGHVRIIRNSDQLDAHVGEWELWDANHGPNDSSSTPPLGIVLSMEGADPVLEPGQVTEWWEAGVRIIGLAHYGRGRYAGGTAVEDGLTGLAGRLLSGMDRLGIILDLTHCSDRSFWEALPLFNGAVIASHSNCRALVPHQRQLSDGQIRAIVERSGVVGVVASCWQLTPGFQHGDSNLNTSLSDLADNIDHICQLAGDSSHAGLGSDLDGGFGREGSPRDVDTIADLQKLVRILEQRGYSHEDVAAIMYRNWVAVLLRAWTATS